MDNDEKRVLKRKRMTIAKHVQLTPEYLEEFRNSNLLTDHTYDLVLGETTNIQKVIKLMELIPPLNDPQTITKLCTILEREYEWLADEIRAELVAERGQLKIDDYIVKESQQLVFREFGASKRLSEREKKEIQNLVALRTQYAKEVWRRRLDLAREELKHLRACNAQKDGQATDLTGDVVEYVRVHAPRLRQENPNGSNKETLKTPRSAKSSRNSTTEEEVEKTILDQLEEALESLKDMTTKSLGEKDSLYDERMRALKVLDLNDINAKLDIELTKKIQEALRKLAEREKEAEANAARAASLRAELDEMMKQSKNDLLAKDKTMEELAAHLNTAHQRIRNMQDELERLRQELAAVQKDCIRYRDRAERLERARRLGYIHERQVLPETIGSQNDKSKPKLTASYSPAPMPRPKSRGLRSARGVKTK